MAGTEVGGPAFGAIGYFVTACIVCVGWWGWGAGFSVEAAVDGAFGVAFFVGGAPVAFGVVVAGCAG